MKFFATAFLLSSPLLAWAATSTTAAAATSSTSNPNPFNIPEDFVGTAGETLDLSWTVTTSGTVSLVLRQGAASSLNAGTTIASNIDNTGSYAWSIPSDTVYGSDYTVEIVSSEGDNYTPYFVINSDVTVASTTTSSTAVGTTTTSGATTETTSGTTLTTSATGVTTLTGTASSTSSSSKTSTSGTASSAGFQSSTSASAATGAAPRATAAAGMIGLVAIGALAL